MNTYVKEFFKRGLIFGGFGPIVMAIIFYIISLCTKDFSVGGGEILLSIVSTYILAFVQAGASVFNQIEHWPLPKSLLCHFGVLYVAYVGCYILNSWIPFEPMVVVIFTAVFIITYFVIWITVFLCVKAAERKMNKKLAK